jgi:hypothetical protein
MLESERVSSDDDDDDGLESGRTTLMDLVKSIGDGSLEG